MIGSGDDALFRRRHEEAVYIMIFDRPSKGAECVAYFSAVAIRSRRCNNKCLEIVRTARNLSGGATANCGCRPDVPSLLLLNSTASIWLE